MLQSFAPIDRYRGGVFIDDIVHRVVRDERTLRPDGTDIFLVRDHFCRLALRTSVLVVVDTLAGLQSVGIEQKRAIVRLPTRGKKSKKNIRKFIFF